MCSHLCNFHEQISTDRIDKYRHLQIVFSEQREGLRTKKRCTITVQASSEPATVLKLATALFNTGLEKKFDSVWISRLPYKLRNENIDGRLTRLLETFFRNRHVFFELRNWKFYTFVNMGSPQRGVLSSLLFIIFPKDFLMQEDCSFNSNTTAHL